MQLRFFIIILLIFSSPLLIGAEFQDRVQNLRPCSKLLFYEPSTQSDMLLFQTGLHKFWQEYASQFSLQNLDYKGYILFSDPYHFGMKQISFLLGTDCSHFVHRLYQIFGAPYPMARTHHFLHLAKMYSQGISAQAYYDSRIQNLDPIQFSQCRWKEFSDSFESIQPDQLQMGDIVVFHQDKDETSVGRGHMGILIQIEPKKIFLHAKAGIGITEQSLDDKTNQEFFFRWKKNIQPLRANSIAELLQQQWEHDPSECKGR